MRALFCQLLSSRVTNNLITQSGTLTKDFNGNSYTFREDGYFNMTKAAQKFGKRLDSFMKSPDTQEYISALEKTLSHDSCDKKVVEVQRGSGLLPQVGTYGHPKLAVFFARWLSAEFAVWCDLMIDNILRGNILKGNIQISVAVLTEETRALKKSQESSFETALSCLSAIR